MRSGLGHPGELRAESEGKTRLGGASRSQIGYFSFAISFLLFLTLSSGCGNKFFDPAQVGRFRDVPAVNVILDSLGVAEETPVAWEEAEEPQPSDIVAVESDYVFGSGDIIRVAIFELLQEGAYFVNDYVVTETGKISIPEVGIVEAAGLTETQLEEEIRQILSPSILKEPLVTVILASSQQRTFSILGDGVPAPSRYIIPRYDFRLTDALAMAGGPRQFNVSYIYVSRSTREKEKKYEPLGRGVGELELIESGITRPKQRGQGTTAPKRRLLGTTAPRAQYRWPESRVVITSSEMITDREFAELPEGYERFSSGTRSRMYARDVPRSSAARFNSKEMVDKPVGARDILETLSERSRRGRSRADEQADIEEVLKPFWEPSRRERRIDERADVEAVLKPFWEPSRRERRMDERADVEAVLKPFWEPSRREKRIDERVGMEDVLKSLREPSRRPERIDERIGQQETLRPSISPAAPEAMDKPSGEAEAGRIEWIFQDGKWVPVPVAPTKPTEDEQEKAGHVEWIFQNGKWIPIQARPPKPIGPVIRVEPEERPVGPLREQVFPDFEWAKAAKTRVMKIPADKLLAGDPRYNVVIKPGDTVYVPVDIIGEFCIMGNVNRTGFIPITGRPMTLKMAIAAAGGLGPLAYPRRCEVVRRIGREKEEIVMVDLDKIASGEQPDFFIKPHDLINVGTHATSRYRAILRNAYRATYGFGFVYDRNFADRDFGGPRPLLDWFF
ncbi:MAG: polysaccharide biosynthesis/export family protein [Planctomycetota bacterium]